MKATNYYRTKYHLFAVYWSLGMILKRNHWYKSVTTKRLKKTSNVIQPYIIRRKWNTSIVKTTGHKVQSRRLGPSRETEKSIFKGK